MGTLIPLDAPHARDPHLVGDKAARLAAVGASGLPVAPGWVVPASISAPTISIGAQVFARSGHAAARLAIAAATLDVALVAELEDLTRLLGGRVVVRSSSAGESDPRWSGAFASYLDVRPSDVATALRGCWASLFSRDVEARCASLGLRPLDLRMAVLIQPHLDLRAGGLARVEADGGVVVSSVTSSPAGLLAGRRTGAVVEVPPGGAGGSSIGGAPPRRVALVAAAVRDATGDDVIEWGETPGGAVVVLQASRAPTAAVPAGPSRRPAAAMPNDAVRIAMMAARFPGPLGEALVMPWAAGQPTVPDVDPVVVSDPAHAFDEVRRLASALTARAWDLPPDEAARAARDTFARVRGGDPAAQTDAIRRLGDLRPVEPHLGAGVIATLEAIGERLVGAHLLASAPLVWHVGMGDLERTLAHGERPTPVAGPDRWEPLLFDVVEAHGLRVAGAAVAPGAGAGAVRLIGPGWFADRPARRQVLVAGHPSPHLAPLLWGCAGLVTKDGSIGAHLFEVARALGVPVVAGVALPEKVRHDGTIVAVDGDAGTVGALVASRGSTAVRRRERVPERVGGRR